MALDIDSIIGETDVEARPYQRTIVGKSTDCFGGRYVDGRGITEEPSRSVMVESATGSGKTVMGHLVAKVMQREIPDLAVGWVAMRRNLLSQAADENRDLSLGVENVHYTSMFDSNPEGLLAHRRAGKPILMVIDEAQHDAATSMTHLYNVLKPDYILGLTATPFRTDKMKLCFDKVIKDAGIHQLIQDGYLSQFHHYSITEWTPKAVCDFYCADPCKWGKSIFYWLTRAQCHEFIQLMMARKDEVIAKLRAGRPDLPMQGGVLGGKREADNFVEFVVGGQNKITEDQLALFRSGDIPCLVNMMMLTEGFNDPTLESAWVRDSGKGPTMQMAGRSFRMHPAFKDGGDDRFKFKRVVQSRNTKWPILKTAMAAEQYLWQSGGWKSLTVNPNLRRINNTARMAIASVQTQLPKFMMDKMGKKAPRWSS